MDKPKPIKQQIAESFVFMNEDQQRLQLQSAIRGSMRLRSHTDKGHKDVIYYEEEQDYIVDYDQGWIARTEGSRIPNWSKHPLCGIKQFDHNLYPDYSNREYTVFGDYDCEMTDIEASNERAAEGKDRLMNVKKKLASGQKVTYVVYGDSISEGGEASEERYSYFSRFSAQLTSLYPDGSLEIVNKAIGGETSEGGAERVNEDVVACLPDLVTIGYGMNDQNQFEYGNTVSLKQYEQNIRFIIETIQSSSDATIVLVTPCQPNPLWQHTSGRIGEYAEVLRRLGDIYQIAVADAYSIWQQALIAGKTPECLLLNNINHPNDYGHYLYYKAFERIIC
ncbi:SGNH/GDSL hydrolase family protein [Paenibacillus psychroresistens]|nr:GDSL-type esterase/lipase family protein [Paenibacillus psychroresistens]